MARIPIDILKPASLPFGDAEDSIRSWASKYKDTLVWGGAIKDRTLPLSDFKDILSGNLLRHGLEEIKEDILSGRKSLGGPGQRILVYVYPDGKAKIAEGNHRLQALFELADEGKISKTFPVPVELHYKGNSDLNSKSWIPRSKRASILRRILAEEGL